MIRFTRYARAEDQSHELPLPVFGSEQKQRSTPYIFSQEEIRNMVQAVSQSGYRTLRRQTYATLFSLLTCTGLHVSEAIRLRFEDITLDGLIIRNSKFRKSRLVPLHETAQMGLECYLKLCRSYAPFDDHLFISLRKKTLRIEDIGTTFKAAVCKTGLKRGPGLPRPTPHSLGHTFTVRALETCPDSRDLITKHILALSTYLGYSSVSYTYWYLEATPDLMRNITESSESFIMGGRP